MIKSEGFTLDIVLPAVDSGAKLLKRLSKLLPKGSYLRLRAKDYKLNEGEFTSGNQVLIGKQELIND